MENKDGKIDGYLIDTSGMPHEQAYSITKCDNGTFHLSLYIVDNHQKFQKTLLGQLDFASLNPANDLNALKELKSSLQSPESCNFIISNQEFFEEDSIPVTALALKMVYDPSQFSKNDKVKLDVQLLKDKPLSFKELDYYMIQKSFDTDTQDEAFIKTAKDFLEAFLHVNKSTDLARHITRSIENLAHNSLLRWARHRRLPLLVEAYHKKNTVMTTSNNIFYNWGNVSYVSGSSRKWNAAENLNQIVTFLETGEHYRSKSEMHTLAQIMGKVFFKADLHKVLIEERDKKAATQNKEDIKNKSAINLQSLFLLAKESVTKPIQGFTKKMADWLHLKK